MPDLVAVWRGAVTASDPRRRVRDAIDRYEIHGRRWHVLAVGKAAAAMAAGAIDALGDEIVGGLVVTVDGAPLPDAVERAVAGGAWTLRRAGHPRPDARSLAAGHAAIALARGVGEDDILLALVSGGASALLCVPREGLTLDEKVARVDEAMRRGAPIAELNRLRTELSAVKGGKLGRLSAGMVLTLVVSDVPGDAPAVVGSGPTVTGRKRDETRLLSGIATFRHAAKKGDGVNFVNFQVEEREAVLEGDVATVADEVAAVARRLEPRSAWVAGGEWTVTVGERAGRGGRATHLALLVARAIAGMADVQVLVAGSDGVDGTGPWAGALVDGDTWARIGEAEGERGLVERDSGSVLAAVGATVTTGPTGVNHADLVIVARSGAAAGSGTGAGARATQGS